jgi:asparagine synthase (glutamine-hydrolysing)
MTDAMAHRGPDAEGFFTKGPVHLAHRRLSIVDLSSGQQPMFNEDGTRAIVYNGEIFNHAALRPELEAAGHRYRSHCDTETVLHAWEQFGPDCLLRFRGMFAFALWDERAQTLFCARDRLGIKPFYYYWDGRLFAFASEIKALFEHPAISPELDTSLLPEYLAFGYVSGEQSLFRNIRKLMPGHHLTLTLSGAGPELRTARYWDVPPPSPAASGRTDADWIAECRRRLEETVEMRLMSDVPLGTFLSGGLDSSAITALVRRMVPGAVKTFSVGYEEAAYSELSWARRAAQHIGTEHREVVVGMDQFFDALPRLIWHEDEPIAWPSSVSLYFVAKLAASEVKVVLTGEGSDELFAGYERYRHYQFNRRWMDRYQHLPSFLRSGVRREIDSSSLLSADVRRKLKHTFLGREDTLESLQLDNFYAAFSQAEQATLLPGNQGRVYQSYLDVWNQAAERPLLERMLYADQKTYLVELLMKQDQMSMAASIESRVPFLDHTFVEFAATVPESLKIRGGEAKYILKKAVEDLLPNDIIYRKKMGFPTPLRGWLAGARAARLTDSLLDPNGLLASCMDLGEVAALTKRHRAGTEDATDRIWRLLNLQMWGDVFLKGNREPREGLAFTGRTA